MEIYVELNLCVVSYKKQSIIMIIKQYVACKNIPYTVSIDLSQGPSIRKATFGILICWMLICVGIVIRHRHAIAQKHIIRYLPQSHFTTWVHVEYIKSIRSLLFNTAFKYMKLFNYYIKTYMSPKFWNYKYKYP